MSKRYLFLVLAFGSLLPAVVFAQGGQKKSKDWLENSAIREDFQSFMGYEDNLAALYLTVPYDVTVCGNQQSRLMDIGILAAAFLPLLLLWSDRLSRIWRIVIGLVLVVYLGLVSYYSVMFKPGGVIMRMSPENLASIKEEVSFEDGFFQALVPRLYSVGQKWAAPLNDLLKQVSGPTDYVTYPMMVLIFVGLSLLFHYRLRKSNSRLGTVIMVMSIYGYLWWIFGGGIIWYGLLFLPVAYLVVTHYLLTRPAPIYGNLGKVLFGVLASLWGFAALLLFLGNINYQTDTGKNMIDFPVALYAMGHLTEEEVINQYFPQAGPALKAINTDEDAVIFKSGSMLSFFIDRNNERVYSDDLLDLFDLIYNAFEGDREQITQLFRASDVRYFLFSLHLAASDRTPEQTLNKKFMDFLRFIYQHPDVQLMATDNLVKVTNPQTGAEEIRPGIYGAPHRKGTYCIMKLN